MDGDGRDEIIIGLGPGGGGWFEIYDDALAGYAFRAWRVNNYAPYNAANGELWPALGDIDGDGRDEIVVGWGTYPANGGWMEVFNDAIAGYGHLWWPRVQWSWYNGANGEARPALGDIDGDGLAEIAVGLDSGAYGWHEVFNDAAAGYGHLQWLQVPWAWYNGANGETRLALGEIQGNGVLDGIGDGEVLDTEASVGKATPDMDGPFGPKQNEALMLGPSAEKTEYAGPEATTALTTGGVEPKMDSGRYSDTLPQGRHLLSWPQSKQGVEKSQITVECRPGMALHSTGLTRPTGSRRREKTIQMKPWLLLDRGSGSSRFFAVCFPLFPSERCFDQIREGISCP